MSMNAVFPLPIESLILIAKKKNAVWGETVISTLAVKLALTPDSGCIPNCVDAGFRHTLTTAAAAIKCRC